jgi:hypothetical protein
MPTRSKLGLEHLEDRTVPAGLNLVWTDAAGTHDWNDRLDWKDTATNQAPANPPTQNDVVTFPAGSPVLCSLTTATGNCAVLNAAVGWNGDLQLDQAAIHVWGANAPQGAVSDWESGSIDAVGFYGGSDLYLDNVDWVYSASSLNVIQASHVPLYIYTYNNTYLTFTDIFVSQGATLEIGYTNANPPAPSTSTVSYFLLTTPNKTVDTPNHDMTYVSTDGTLNLGQNVKLTGAEVTSSGTVLLNDGSNLVNAANTQLIILAGSLKTSETGTASITGDVTMQGGTIRMGDDLGAYSELDISGVLNMRDAAISVDINNAHGTQCDQIIAAKVNLNGNDQCFYNPSGTATQGAHIYNVLTGNNGLTGTFDGGVTRTGPNLQTWTPNYLATVFDLQGVI